MLGCQLHFKDYIYILFQMIYMSIFFLYTPMYRNRVTENQSSFQQSAIFGLIIYVTVHQSSAILRLGLTLARYLFCYQSSLVAC